MIYLVIIPALLSISISLCLAQYIATPALWERTTTFYLPGSAQKACEESKTREIYVDNQRCYNCFSWSWPADVYGHLNLIVAKNHQAYYHNIYRPIDENPCHHLDPNKTQIPICETDIRVYAMHDLKNVIISEVKKQSQCDRFIVTFSFLDGAPYQDMVTVLDLMDECNVKIYCMRDLTSTEMHAMNNLSAIHNE